MEIKAIIFDLDGTVIENDVVYQEAFQEVFDSLGEKPGARLTLVGGIGVKGEWDKLKDFYKLKTKKFSEELSILTQQRYLAKLDSIYLKKGFKEFIRKIKKDGVKVALATSNNRSVVDDVLKKFDLEGFFDTVTTAEEVRYQKPQPDIFKITAEKLDLDFSSCLVVEDSQAGILAAHEAGMKVVGIARDNKHREVLKEADIVIDDYSKLTDIPFKGETLQSVINWIIWQR